MRKPRILIVEDEDAIMTGLTDALVFHGFEVEGAADGRRGLDLALSGRFDLVLLDVMLPGVDGFAICDEIRRIDRDQAIIMLTARTEDEDIVAGLKLGADDYIAKPFSVAELVLRVKAVLRRARVGREALATLELPGHVVIDMQNLSGRRADEPLAFTRREIDILDYLRLHADRPVAREELLNKVWGYDRHAEIETRTVDIHIAKLRRKIEPDPGTPRNIVTVRGAGYRLMLEADDG